MAHQIMGNRIMVRDVPAWHSLGAVFTDNPSAKEANERIGGNEIIIDKLPYTVNVPDYGNWIPDNRYVLVRRPTSDDNIPRNFGEVSQEYTVLQNGQIAELVDMLIDGTNKKWKLETAGILRDGESIFFSLKGDDFKIAGDDCGMYFGVSDQRNGGSAIDLAATPIRYVCANTLRMGLNNSKARITINHHPALFQEVQWRMNVIASLLNEGKSLINALQRLEKIQVDEKRMQTILDRLFPAPKMPRSLELKGSGVQELIDRAGKAEYHYEWRKKTNDKVKVEILANYQYLTEGYGNTGWAAYNAVTGWIDHQSGKDTKNGKRVMAEGSISAAMDKVRMDAYNLIVASK